MTEKKNLDKAIETILEESRNIAERDRAEKGKRAIYGVFLFVVLVILGSALLGVAFRVFIAFAGL